jgi:hypothetical protein
MNAPMALQINPQVMTISKPLVKDGFMARSW